MYESTLKRLRTLASLKLTLFGISVLLVAVLLAYFNRQDAAVYIVPPVALLALNLLAAMIFNPRIRQNSGLLMFHICLFLIALLTLMSQLTSMQGRVEVTEGTAFDAAGVTVVKQGAWHALDRLQQIDFSQGAIEVEYGPGLRRGASRSQLQHDGNNIVVGDNLAFSSLGYRFYTTSNKGFAAIVNWYAKDGSVERGAIHFPSYPLYDWKQHNQWQLPSGAELEMQLLIDTALQPEHAWLLQGVDRGQLEITLPDASKHRIAPGQHLQLDNGVLQFEAIRMWMGYKIFYDPLLAWFFAVALVGVAGIGWHYYLKLASTGNRRLRAGNTRGRGRAVPGIQS